MSCCPLIHDITLHDIVLTDSLYLCSSLFFFAEPCSWRILIVNWHKNTTTWTNSWVRFVYFSCVKSDHVNTFCHKDLTTDRVRKYRYSCAIDKGGNSIKWLHEWRQTIAVCIDSKTVLKAWEIFQVATDYLKFYPFPNKDCTLTS